MQMSNSQRVKHLMKRYGWVAVGTHSVVYVTTLSSIFLLIHNGVDVVGIAQQLHLDKWVSLDSVDSGAGEFVVRLCSFGRERVCF